MIKKAFVLLRAGVWGYYVDSIKLGFNFCTATLLSLIIRFL